MNPHRWIWLLPLVVMAFAVTLALRPPASRAQDDAGAPAADSTESERDASSDDSPSPAAIRVALLRVDAPADEAEFRNSICFADAFLSDVARRAKLDIHRSFDVTTATKAGLADYPFIIHTGSGRFELTKAEQIALADYLKRGGFILASASCSSAEFADSFHREIQALLPRHKLERLADDHAVFHTLYDIDDLTTKSVTGHDVYLEGITIDGRLAVVFSREGLNDTAAAGNGCCCCGGNELRYARRVNANLLTYALTH